MKRYAIVRNARDQEQLAAYLPDNYEVMHEVADWPLYDGAWTRGYAWVIRGEDVAGWTLDDYVIPRLASGLLWAEEIDLSHPIMREVPA